MSDLLRALETNNRAAKGIFYFYRVPCVVPAIERADADVQGLAS